MNIYAEMIGSLQTRLVAQGIPEKMAVVASVAAVEKMRAQLGGCNVYLPKNTTLREKCARDHAIRAEFNGKNLKEICRKHRVSRVTVYRACRKSFILE